MEAQKKKSPETGANSLFKKREDMLNKRITKHFDGFLGRKNPENNLCGRDFKPWV